MFCDEGEGVGWRGVREVRERRDICSHVADSLHCTAEISTKL